MYSTGYHWNLQMDGLTVCQKYVLIYLHGTYLLFMCPKEANPRSPGIAFCGLVLLLSARTGWQSIGID
jgi:hypothetical protein